MRTTCPAHVIFLDLIIILIIFSEEYSHGALAYSHVFLQLLTWRETRFTYHHWKSLTLFTATEQIYLWRNNFITKWSLYYQHFGEMTKVNKPYSGHQTFGVKTETEIFCRRNKNMLLQLRQSIDQGRDSRMRICRSCYVLYGLLDSKHAATLGCGWRRNFLDMEDSCPSLGIAGGGAINPLQ
jgi:hypothetical protein